MKKIIIIMIMILFIASAVLAITVIKTKQNEEIYLLKIDIANSIEKQDYEAAYNILIQQHGSGKRILSKYVVAYINEICERAKADLYLDEIIKIKEAGFDYQILYDAEEYIQSRLEQIIESQVNFENGISLYNQRYYDDARAEFENVISEDDNYNAAQAKIEEINELQNSWSTNGLGRNPYINAVAFDGEYAYIPYRASGVDGIYKVSADGSEKVFLGLSSGKATLKIYGINIVGEFIYFIAGEKVGSGYIFDSPYNIYRMKKDGSDVTLEIEGNFTDLFIDGDKAYAITRENGLVEFDKYLTNPKTISSQSVVEFSYSQNGLYYTVEDGLEHDSNNTIYLYKNNFSTRVYSGQHMHYYDFSDRYLKMWTSTHKNEILNLGRNGEEEKVVFTNIYKVYGIVDNKILYSGFGLFQQEREYFYNLDSRERIAIGAYATVMEYEIKGIFYEQNKILIEKKDGLYFSDVTGNNLEKIADAKLEETGNMNEIIGLNDEELYSEAGKEQISFIEDKQIWHYKNHQLNLYIEKKYLEEYDSNVYITHIFTNDFSLLKIGNGGESATDTKTYRAYEISDKYQAIYAQSGDTFLDSRNTDRGIVIRDGIIIRDKLTYDIMAFFNDGSAEVYHKDDNITAQQLVDMGVHTTLAFGPILVENREVSVECAYDELAVRNPRSAIGYVEPGHYVMIVCDGRDDEVSKGLGMIQLAKLFEDEGCETAYNLDGGSTSTITFFGNYITRRTGHHGVPEIYNHRMVAELIYIGTSQLSPLDLSDYTISYQEFSEQNK